MTATAQTQLAMIGCGGMARHHIRVMLEQQETTNFLVVCEPSPQAYEETAALFDEAGLVPPPNQPDLDTLLAEYGDQLDATFIITPHVFHHDQTKACLEAGLDVLLEKPMVINGAEAESLIKTRDETGKLLVVAFPGSLSPRIRKAESMLRSGEVGELLNISATVWQSWKEGTANTWRQVPEVAGGGFLFDTGAHMLNTVVDLAGEEFTEVAAWLDNRGTPVEILGTIMGRLKSGAMVTMNGCGEAIKSCHSDVRVFTKGAIIRTGIWGEFLEVQYDGDPELTPIETKPSMGVWEQFLAVRNGEIENPCPPEVGLRMAKLWDAINESAAQGGKPVTL